jgi:hypothetical protein
MPDSHGMFKGISVPRLPWLDDNPHLTDADKALVRPPVTPQEDEAFEELDNVR